MTKINGGRCQAMPRRLILTAAAMAALAPVAGTASAAGPERSLAGISIFAPGSSVTAKFGNPSRILVGGVAPSAASAATGAGGPGGGSSGYPGSSPGGSGGPSSLPGFGQQLGSQMSQMMGGSSGEFPGGSSGGYPGGGSSGGYPGSSSGGYPGGGSSGGYPGGSGGAAVTGPPPKQPVTLIYDRQYGGSLEFTVSADKRVIQIRETGYSGAYGTARGIRLGVSYAQVVARYGYPENTYIQGSIISTDYKDTLHCGFQFLDQKLVGIIVASPD